MHNLHAWLLKGTYVVFTIIAVVLIIASIVIRNTKMITMSFGKFLIELFAMSVIMALPVYIFTYTRNMNFKKCSMFVLFFIIKLAVLHVLLEISGLYDKMLQAY